MELALFSVLCVILSLSVYCYMQRRDMFANNKLHLKELKPKNIKQAAIYVLVMITIFSVMLMLCLFYERQISFILKRLFVIAFLWGAAISDYREMRIPNKLILTGLAGRAVLLVFELIFSLDSVVFYLKSEGLALVAVIVLCIICLLFAKGSMGMGDVKLLMILAIFLGIEGICYSLFVTVFFSSITAIIQLILKKKQKKDTMPFAPFVLVGTIVCLILSGV